MYFSFNIMSVSKETGGKYNEEKSRLPEILGCNGYIDSFYSLLLCGNSDELLKYYSFGMQTKELCRNIFAQFLKIPSEFTGTIQNKL